MNGNVSNTSAPLVRDHSVFDIPIPLVLTALGKGTPESGGLGQYVRRGMFLSPFVNEKTPSFHWVNNRGQNCWHCFATNQGGGVRDLVMLVNHCSEKEAIAFLEKIAPYNVRPSDWKGLVRIEDSGRIEVDSYGPIRHKALYQYGESRGIPASLLDAYCCQVSYHYSSKEDRRFYSLGISNIQNGFVLSNRTRNGKLKLCTSCAPTVLDSAGKFSLEPSSESVIVCEGFWDALSLMRLFDRQVPGYDMLILNSLSCSSVGSFADSYMKEHKYVNLFLDHDVKSQAGQRKTAELIARYPDKMVSDCSGLYADFKDINDLLMASIRCSEMKQVNQIKLK